MNPTMYLRQKSILLPNHNVNQKDKFSVTMILEQKWVDPARPYEHEWRPVPVVDLYGTPIAEGGSNEQSDKRTGKGDSPKVPG